MRRTPALRALIRETVLMPSYRDYAARCSPSTISSQFANRFQLAIPVVGARRDAFGSASGPTPVWSTILCL